MTFGLQFTRQKLRATKHRLVRLWRFIVAKFSHEPYRLAVLLLLLLLEVLALFGIDKEFSFGLYFDQQSAIVEVFSVVIGALAAILGIVIAFLIATFEMNKRYLSSNYAESLFRNDTLRGLVVLYVGTIIISLSGLVAINSKEVSLITNLALITSYLFIVCIVVLIPRMRQLVAETNTSKEIAKIADIMVARASPGYFSIGEPQLNLLMEIGKKASAEGEESIVIELVNVLNDKLDVLTEYLGKDEGIIHRAQPRDMASSFAAIFYVIGKATLLNRQQNITEYAARSLLHLMTIYAQKQQMYYTLIEAEKYFIKLTKAVIADGNEELVSSLVYGFNNFVETQFKHNTPPAEELFMFEAFDKSRDNKDIKYDLNNHWHHISSDYIFKYRDLIKHAIKHSNGDALQTLLSSLQSLSRDIISMDELTDEHKQRTLGQLGYTLEWAYTEAINGNIITREDNFLIFMLDPHYDLDEIVKAGQNYSVWNLQRVCKIFLYASKKGVISSQALNNIGTAGRSLKHLIKDSQLAARAVIYIATILGKIKDVVADDVKSDLWSAQIYLACYEQARSIQKWDKKVKVRSVTIKLNKLLQEYDRIDDAKQTLKLNEDDLWQELFGDDNAKRGKKSS